MGDLIYLLGQLPVAPWVLILGMLVLLVIAIVAGRSWMHYDNRTQLHREVDEYRDRL